MKRIKPRVPDTNLVTVGSVPDAIDAELVRNKLIEHEVGCELDGENQGGLIGVFSIGILVCEHDAAKARKIMGMHFPHLFDSDQISDRLPEST